MIIVYKAAIILSFLAITTQSNKPYMLCERSTVRLQATTTKQLLVSTLYENVNNESAFCLWEIRAANISDVVEFRVVHWFAPLTSDCSKDYLLISDDAGMWTRPLRIWCESSVIDPVEVMKTRTETLSIELVSSMFWQDRVVFTLEYWTAAKDIEIVKAVEFGPANYVLFAVSGLLGVSLIIGCVILVFKDYSRCRAVKLLSWKEKLMTRRKGISGETMNRRDSTESFAQSDVTSYIQLTETPTSIRCSSAWTPSPVTRISVSTTPTSGNFSL